MQITRCEIVNVVFENREVSKFLSANKKLVPRAEYSLRLIMKYYLITNNFSRREDPKKDAITALPKSLAALGKKRLER